MATIRTRKRGKTFSYSFDVGKNPATGKRKMMERSGFSTEQEAYDAGTAAYTDWKRGKLCITSERVPLHEYLAAWLESIAHSNVTRLTYEDYALIIRARILPHIGGIILHHSSPPHKYTFIMS